VKLDPGAHVFHAFGFALKSGCDKVPPTTGCLHWRKKRERGPNCLSPLGAVSGFTAKGQADVKWKS
jgi:hypothetical protein